MSGPSRAAQALVRRERRQPEKTLAAIALAVACFLGGCDSSTPTPPSSPAASPAARVDASALANGVQAPPSSGDAAPTASAAPQPTPTPDPEAVRKVAAVQYLAAEVANVEAFQALSEHKWSPKAAAEVWGHFAGDLTKLEVPTDTAGDLRDLIRKVKKVQALQLDESGHFARMADFYTVARHLRNARSKMSNAVDRVRSDLDLPALCRAGCS